MCFGSIPRTKEAIAVARKYGLYYPTNTDPHRESRFCMVIKRDERKFLHSPLPRIGGGGTIFVARMLTRDLFAVANLLVLFVYYLFRLEHFEHSLTH